MLPLGVAVGNLTTLYILFKLMSIDMYLQYTHLSNQSCAFLRLSSHILSYKKVHHILRFSYKSFLTMSLVKLS